MAREKTEKISTFDVGADFIPFESSDDESFSGKELLQNGDLNGDSRKRKRDLESSPERAPPRQRPKTSNVTVNPWQMSIQDYSFSNETARMYHPVYSPVTYAGFIRKSRTLQIGLLRRRKKLKFVPTLSTGLFRLFRTHSQSIMHIPLEAILPSFTFLMRMFFKLCNADTGILIWSWIGQDIHGPKNL